MYPCSIPGITCICIHYILLNFLWWIHSFGLNNKFRADEKYSSFGSPASPLLYIPSECFNFGYFTGFDWDNEDSFTMGERKQASFHFVLKNEDILKQFIDFFNKKTWESTKKTVFKAKTLQRNSGVFSWHNTCGIQILFSWAIGYGI